MYIYPNRSLTHISKTYRTAALIKMCACPFEVSQLTKINFPQDVGECIGKEEKNPETLVRAFIHMKLK